MATMAAVDLGAQSGRVAVGRFDGGRLERRPRCTGSRTTPVDAGGTLHWDVVRLLPRRAGRTARGGG